MIGQTISISSLFSLLKVAAERFERVLAPSKLSDILTLDRKLSLSTIENFSPAHDRREPRC